MEKLIGNDIKIFFKNDIKTINGILVDIDENYNYIQVGQQQICVIPKQNILYYEIIQLSSKSKVIESGPQKSIDILVDENKIMTIQVDEELTTNEILAKVYDSESVKEYLKGKIQTSVECFDNAINIITNSRKSNSQVSFSANLNIPDAYTGPVDLAQKLDRKISK